MISLSAHQHYPKNSLGRDFFVGDIHGKFDFLMQALTNIEFDYNRDRLFSVGDVIDRGEASFNCLLATQNRWFFPVMGNHEQFLWDVAHGKSGDELSWYINGGSWWGALTSQGRGLAKNIVEQCFSLTLSVETLAGYVGVVHAQYPLQEWPLKKEQINKELLHTLLWSRDCLADSHQHIIENIDFIVSGHTPLSEPLFKNKQLFIDTGSGHSANSYNPNPRLTICQFKEKHIEFYMQAEQFYKGETIKF